MISLTDDLESLRRDLESSDSATAVLQARCEALGLPGGPRVRACLEPDAPVADAAVRALLDAGPGEVLACRRVRLVWGSLVLSRATNWYRPDRLSPDMRRRLAETDEPFGVVARPLGYRRRRLETTLIKAGVDPAARLRCRAVLETPDGRPLALVDEIYPGD